MLLGLREFDTAVLRMYGLDDHLPHGGHLCGVAIMRAGPVHADVAVRMIAVSVAPGCRVRLAGSQVWDWSSSLPFLLWGEYGNIYHVCFPFTSFGWN